MGDMRSRMLARAAARGQSDIRRLVEQAAGREAGHAEDWKWIELRQIRMEDRVQVRTGGLDEDTIEAYAIDMTAHGFDPFPPIVLFDDGSAYWLAAGFHRIAAARRAGLSSVKANVYEGSVSDAYWFALTDNLTNGLPMSKADKKEALKRLLGLGSVPLPEGEPVPSYRELAGTLKVSHPTISAWVKEIQDEAAEAGGKNLPVREKRATADGRTIRTKSIRQANKKRGPTVRHLRQRVLRDLASAHDNMAQLEDMEQAASQLASYIDELRRAWEL